MLAGGELGIRTAHSRERDATRAAAELEAALAGAGLATLLFFCSPVFDREHLGKELRRRFAGVELIGVTTAGEIGERGYLTGSIAAIGFESPAFHVAKTILSPLAGFGLGDEARAVAELEFELSRRGVAFDPGCCFALLLIDGLSMREEMVANALQSALGDVMLFGGSAGDGLDFARTYVFADGSFRSDAAVLVLFHTERPFRVFNTQHFEVSDTKLVITGADVERRIVTEINGGPAAEEYAEVLGLERHELSPEVFARNPLLLRMGGRWHVRSIQKANEDESLTIYCAIDEGLVLTLGRGMNLVENLASSFASVRDRIGTPRLVIGCDCILRRLEVEQFGLRNEVEELFQANHTVGFSTYGEQFGALHVNQTFTAVAIG